MQGSERRPSVSFAAAKVLAAVQGLENIPHENLGSHDLMPELVYEDDRSTDLPMPVLSPVRTGRSPLIGSSTSESGSHQSPVVEICTTQDTQELPQHEPSTSQVRLYPF